MHNCVGLLTLDLGKQALGQSACYLSAATASSLVLLTQLCLSLLAFVDHTRDRRYPLGGAPLADGGCNTSEYQLLEITGQGMRERSCAQVLFAGFLQAYCWLL
ncbi:Hypothetical predicted protein [Podarcis lilfordi]|uniref:Uncharacterized protein n=1 Tax=Podarcis lilfordi TaxID=74358 RepID=A0AA35JY34_9SAUR|nr:Hypothetical predicted protein [Podarcis lilfordi]